MSVRSCLNDPASIIVVDASVAINLHASGVPRLILDALKSRIAVVSEVVRELEAKPQGGRAEAATCGELFDSGRIEVVQLGDDGMGYFAELVSGSTAESLDDGEAATIAYALESGATAIIDERKATRICAERYVALRTACTLDVLMQRDVQRALGPAALAEAVFNALYYGRMRVPAHYMDVCINIIGPDRAAQCNSLPATIRCTSK